MKEFQFNEFGVCMNPNIYFKAGSFQLQYSIEIRTAMDERGKWLYGFDYTLGCGRYGGGGDGCNRRNGGYLSEADAARAAFLNIREWLKSQLEDIDPNHIDPDGTHGSTVIGLGQEILKIISRELNRQLELDL